ncbi:hypothetical protein Tco_0393777 [Tanacetum coccineum]
MEGQDEEKKDREEDEVDMNNVDAFMPVSPIPSTIVHKDYPVEQIIRDLNSVPQTRRMAKNLEEHVEKQEGNPSIAGSELLQALMDGKKIIITESIVRRDLQLEDAEGIDCLPNATIFEQLTLMGMVKNLENVSGKFLMYPRFVQVFLNKQVDGMSKHNGIYVMPSHTKKIFGNMKKGRKRIFWKRNTLISNNRVQAQEEMGEGSANPTNPHHTPTIIQPSTSQPQKKQRSRRPKRKDTEVPQPSGPIDNVADEAVYEEIDDSLEKATTTATSLDAEQDMGNINKTQSKAALNEPSSFGTSSGSGPRRQETMGVTIAHTRSENVSKLSNDPLLARGNSLRSGEVSLRLKELMELCTNLQNRVIDLEKTKTSQAQEIISLKRRVKRLEKKNRSKTHGLKILYKVGLSARIESSKDEGLGEEDASKQGRIDDIDANEDIYMVNVHRDEDMFGINDLEGDEVIVETEVDHEVVVETEVTSKDVNISVDEVTLAQALAALKSAKPKADKVMLQEPEQDTITTITAATTVTAASTRPKAKGLVIHKEDKATTPTVSSQQPSQVKVQDKGKGILVEEPLKMKKKDQISFDEQEAIRLQAKINEEERLAREKMKPILQAQEQEELTNEEKVRLFLQFLEQRRKHFVAKRAEEKRNTPPTRAQQRSIMCTYLKNMEGWKLKRLKNKIELMEEHSKKAEVMEESSKKAEAEIAQESTSKRAGEALEQKSSKKFKKTEPVNYMDNFSLLNLKTMFEQHAEDSVWKNQQGLVKVLIWKLYDSCRVHYVTMRSILYCLLVEKMYPLTNHTLHQMFNDVKLQVDYECEMAFELLRLVKKQLKEGYGRIVGIKRLHDNLEVTAAKVCVTAAKLKTADEIKENILSSYYGMYINNAADTIDTVTSVLTQKELDAFCVKWHVHASVELQLPGPNDTIRDSPEGKIVPLVTTVSSSRSTVAVTPLVAIPRILPPPSNDIANLEFVDVLSKNPLGFSKYLETDDLVIRPSGKIISLVDHNNHDEIEDVAKNKGKKKRVAFEGSLLPVKKSVLGENLEIGSSTAAMDAFVSSSVTPSLAPEGEGESDSVSQDNLRTKPASERFSLPVQTEAATVTLVLAAGAGASPAQIHWAGASFSSPGGSFALVHGAGTSSSASGGSSSKDAEIASLMSRLERADSEAVEAFKLRYFVMSDSEDSIVTYTEVSSPFEDLSDIGSPGVDGLPMMLEDPYVEAALQAPPSPDYVSGPEYPPLPVYVPYIPEPVYPEFMPPEDDVLPAEEQPLPAAVSPTANSPGYITESDPQEDLEEDDEDPEEDPTDYPDDRDDDDDEEESSRDDADDEEEDEDEDEEDEEHPAPADSVPPPVHRVTARMSVLAQTPISLPLDTEVARLLAIPTPPPSPLSPLSSPLPQILSPLPQIPSPPLPVSPPPLPASPAYPLGYRAAMIQLRAESPYTSHPLPLPLPSTIVLPYTRASMAIMRAVAPSTYILASRSKTPP